MKTLLLLGCTLLLCYSCTDLPKSGSANVSFDIELEYVVEMEEIDVELKDLTLNDSMNGKDRTDGVKDNTTSLVKMKDEVPRVFLPKEFPNLEHKEEVHVKIQSADNRNGGSIKMVCIPPVSPSDLTMIPDEDGIYNFPEIDAQYPGGVQELRVFIADNLIYPDNLYSYEGTVYISFIVEADGCLTHRKVLRGVSEELDQEALRVVRAMPKWIPAQDNGEFVASRVRLPITFKLN